MRAAVVIVALALAACAHAKWSQLDVATQFTFAGFMTVDVMETPPIMDECHELNPVLGPCGGRLPLPLYLLGVIVAEAGIANALPLAWRRVFEGLSIGIEASVVEWNLLRGYTPNGKGRPIRVSP